MAIEQALPQFAVSFSDLPMVFFGDLPLAFQFASPGPILFEWGPILIRWYGFLIASAVLIGVTLSRLLATRRSVDPEIISDLAIWLVVAAIPSARLYYVLFQWQEYAQRPDQIIAIWNGGIAIHGAVLGGLVAALIFARMRRVPFWQLADLVAPSLILGQAIGRWGNFFNSEAFGRPTDLPWKLYIPLNRRPPGYEGFSYFHPTFLYESCWNLMVFGVLIGLFLWGLKVKPRLRLGTIFLVYLILYGCGRFWIEGLRTDSLMLGSLRIAQVVSLVEIMIGSLGLVWLYRGRRNLPDVVRVQESVVSSTPPQSE
ncbi:MAG: prolipoprotein diacylglyceryl transferase [Kovacikia sp.]